MGLFCNEVALWCSVHKITGKFRSFKCILHEIPGKFQYFQCIMRKSLEIPAMRLRPNRPAEEGDGTSCGLVSATVTLLFNIDSTLIRHRCPDLTLF